MSNLGTGFEYSEVNEWRALLKELSGLNDEEIVKLVFRIEQSGAHKNATMTSTANLLEGDVAVDLIKSLHLPKNILIECKHRKSSRKTDKTHPIEKFWVDQALHEAVKNNRLSILAIKFKGIKPNAKELRDYLWYTGKFGNSVHYIMPRIHFFELITSFIHFVHKLRATGGVDLQGISTVDLLVEIKRRLDQKEK